MYHCKHAKIKDLALIRRSVLFGTNQGFNEQVLNFLIELAGYIGNQTFSSSTEDEDEKAEAAKVTRDNLKQSPELQKLLSDLYEDVENDDKNADVITPKPQNRKTESNLT